MLLSSSGHPYDKAGVLVKEQPNAIFFVVASDHGALRDTLDLKIWVHFLKFGFGFFDRFANKLLV
jgi:hypothetical protein